MGDEGLDADVDAVEQRLVERVQALVLDAARELFPFYVSVWDRPRDAVQPNDAAASSGDLACRAPCTLWNRLRAEQHRCCAGQPDDGLVRVVTTSDYGVERTREYGSAVEVAEALVTQLPDVARHVVADVRVRPDGSLLFATRVHMCRQRAAGLVHCTACGGFFAGLRGLRNHWHGKHGSRYEDAKASAEAACRALVPYGRFDDAEVRLLRASTARAEAAEREAAALPAGLAAARDGDVGTLRDLLSAGWDPKEATDRHGSTPMIWAAGGGHLASCKLLYCHGASVCYVQPANANGRFGGRTALHWAARNGHLEVCEWLVACDADPNALTSDGSPPLHWAVWQGRLPVCQWLVNVAGARLHTRNSFGCNAFQWAAQCPTDDAVPLCRWLHARGLDARVLNRNGHSALHKAAIKGSDAVCDWLLNEGGLGEAHMLPDRDGNTPAAMAHAEGFAELAARLEAAVAAVKEEQEMVPATGAGPTGEAEEATEGAAHAAECADMVGTGATVTTATSAAAVVAAMDASFPDGVVQRTPLSPPPPSLPSPSPSPSPPLPMAAQPVAAMMPLLPPTPTLAVSQWNEDLLPVLRQARVSEQACTALSGCNVDLIAQAAALSRLEFLSFLRDVGVQPQPERQRIANAIAAARRGSWPVGVGEGTAAPSTEAEMAGMGPAISQSRAPGSPDSPYQSQSLTEHVVVAPGGAEMFLSPLNWALSGGQLGSTGLMCTANPGAYLKLEWCGASGPVALVADTSALDRPFMVLSYTIDNGPRQLANLHPGDAWVVLPLHRHGGAADGPDAVSGRTANGTNGRERDYGRGDGVDCHHTLMLAVERSVQSFDRWGDGSGAPPACALRVREIRLPSGSTPCLPSILHHRRLLAFGCSLTEGVSALVQPGVRAGDLLTNAGSSSWVASLADEIGAEYGLVGFGRQGWLVGGNGGVPEFQPGGKAAGMSAAWRSHWSGVKRQLRGPWFGGGGEAVTHVIAMHGTNDGITGQHDADVTAAATAWLAAVRDALGPKPLIFLVVPFGGFCATALTLAMLRYQEGCGRLCDVRTHLIDLGAEASRNLAGFNIVRGRYQHTPESCDGVHPTARRHLELGQMLAKCILEIERSSCTK